MKIPGRIVETETLIGSLDEEFIREGMEEFFRLLQRIFRIRVSLFEQLDCAQTLR